MFLPWSTYDRRCFLLLLLLPPSAQTPNNTRNALSDRFPRASPHIVQVESSLRPPSLSQAIGSRQQSYPSLPHRSSQVGRKTKSAMSPSPASRRDHHGAAPGTPPSRPMAARIVAPAREGGGGGLLFEMDEFLDSCRLPSHCVPSLWSLRMMYVSRSAVRASALFVARWAARALCDLSERLHAATLVNDR